MELRKQEKKIGIGRMEDVRPNKNVLSAVRYLLIAVDKNIVLKSVMD